MIRSMTAYSSARGEERGFSLSVGIRSTNHRFLDLKVRLPQALEAAEPRLRRLVSEHVARGHLEITVTLEQFAAGQVALNRAMAASYLQAWKLLRDQFGLSADPDLVSLLRIPGIMTADGEPSPEALEAFAALLERVTGEALERLNQMRAREGEALERDLRSRFQRLEKLAKDVGALADRAPSLYRERLQARIRELLKETPAGVEIDQGRLAQEVAYWAARTDVAEELTRLASHLEQVSQLLGSGGDVGKKLDFLLQEMNREANTLLSKTTDVPDAGPEMASLAIEMKTEVEKLREQAQNIE